MRPIRVLLADHHPVFRLGIQTLLQQIKDHRVEVVGEVSCGHKAVTETARLQPDIVLLDLTLPDLDGIETTRQILRFLPKTRIIMLAATDDNHTIVECIRAGVAGYVVKTILPYELVKAVLTIAAGQVYFSKETASNNQFDHGQEAFHPSASAGPKVLTKRELEILRLVAEEKSNHEIADILYLSPRTVETHKRNMLLKLKMKNVAGLVKYYLQQEGQAMAV